MEDLFAVVFIEDARPRSFIAGKLLLGVVVVHLSVRDFLLGERNVVIEVKVALI